MSFNYEVIFLDAAKSGDLPTVTEMVEGCDVDLEKRTASGMTAVALAASQGHVPVLRYLADQDADINARAHDGCTPLHLAILDEHIDAVAFLLSRGADVKAATPEGETPLDWAEDCDAIRQLLLNAPSPTSTSV